MTYLKFQMITPKLSYCRQHYYNHY